MSEHGETKQEFYNALETILAADPEENPAKAYAKLTRVGKRSNRAVNPNAEQDQDQAEQGTEGGERRDSKAIHRPFAPTTYARNSGKSRGTGRIVLETRRTHYSAAVYQQFANMPDETKYCSRSNEIVLVKHCIHAVKQGRDTKESLTELRDRLHQMQFYDFLSKRLISLGAMPDEAKYKDWIARPTSPDAIL
ncbi:MAG: hypothetical protein Q9192_005377 [Flavoplaca navasiana]